MRAPFGMTPNHLYLASAALIGDWVLSMPIHTPNMVRYGVADRANKLTDIRQGWRALRVSQRRRRYETG